jgi:microcystin-dependent protein
LDPDLRGRFVLSSGSGKDLRTRIIGEQGGEENHTLTIHEMPRHNHLWTRRPFHDEYGSGHAEWHWDAASADKKNGTKKQSLIQVTTSPQQYAAFLRSSVYHEDSVIKETCQLSRIKNIDLKSDEFNFHLN